MGTLLPHLAAVCRAARERAGRRQADVALVAGVSQWTIGRFERAVSWPEDPDRVMQAYGDECHIDPQLLWRRALDHADISS